MSEMLYSEAIREAMSVRMRENKNVILFGEDVGPFGGGFGITGGMCQEFGEDRVRDTPISENVIVGTAVGAAATGLRPIAELMFNDFLPLAMDQLANQAAKMRYMFGGKISLPMVVRLPCGAGIGSAAQHSQSLEALVTHIPGLKVVFPSTPQDAYGLMLASIDDDNPVMFMEHKRLYQFRAEVTSFDPIPLGVGDIKRAGGDITVIATGRMVHESLRAADILAKDGIELEVLDPRSLYPLDKALIGRSLEKTHKAIVMTEETRRGAYAGEISAIIAEEFFDSLDAPVARIGSLNSPVPSTPGLEQFYMPNADDIIAAARKF